MKDFTLEAYAFYLNGFKNKGYDFVRFDEFMSQSSSSEKLCLVRHDVDRKPMFALRMAKLEKELGVKSTYYFRAKKCSFDKRIIKEIAEMGHEIGLHYESLSDTNGNVELALKDFEKNLKEFRQVADIKTCSMHGRPLKPFDNRDIWKSGQNHSYLKEKLGMIGEVYLDIDYSDIAYINDTGRNWTQGKANRRDVVDSTISVSFGTQKELIDYLENEPHDKICFQIHPERWTDSNVELIMQSSKDKSINLAKKVISTIKRK